MAKHKNQLPTLVQLAKALSDESRVRMLAILFHGELCVCQLTKLLGLAPSTISRHLSVMRQAGLIASRKEERWVIYRIADGDTPPAVQESLAWARNAVKGDRQIAQDKRTLLKIRNVSREELCRVTLKN